MRLVNLRGRLALLSGDRACDVADLSAGRFSPDPQAVYERWGEFVEWAGTVEFDGEPFDVRDLGAPAPRPRQVFAIGLNYDAHAQESGFVRPTDPVVFTKFPSSITGPVTEVLMPAGSIDWEVELVVVLGRDVHQISAERAWSVVAGLTIGQDISERESQHRGPAPQFNLAKSHAGFSPMGPALVTLDEIDDPDDLTLGCEINGESVQHGHTMQMIFPVPELVSRLSQIVTLYAGDVIYTGTPAGVGAGRKPPRFLANGDVLRSYIDGLGELQQKFVSPESKSRLATVGSAGDSYDR